MGHIVDRRFREPIFLVPPLKRVVRELGWGSYFLGPQLGYVSFQLDTSITQLEKQVNLSETNHRHLERQLATAHLLKGAMHVAEASAAEQSNDGNRALVSSALNHFQSALAVDGNDCEALEYAAHMHVCLRQDQDANDRLGRRADIAASRNNPGVAAAALKEGLKVLPNLHGADRIEEAEINENLGDRRITLGAHRKARSNWELAKALYGELAGEKAGEAARRVAAKLAQLDKLPDKDRDEDDDS